MKLRYIGALLIFAEYVIIKQNPTMFEGMKFKMDYVIFGSLLTLVLGFAFDIWRSFKDKRDLTKDHDQIKENSDTNKNFILGKTDVLSSEHDNLSGEHDNLSGEHGRILESTHELKHRSEQLISSVDSIDRQMREEKAYQRGMREAMTPVQIDVERQIKAVNALCDQMMHLQKENADLRLQNNDLKYQLQQAQEQVQDFQEHLPQYESPSEDLENNSFTVMQNLSLDERLANAQEQGGEQSQGRPKHRKDRDLQR